LALQAGRRPLARLPTPAVDIAVAVAAAAFTIAASVMVDRGTSDDSIDLLGYGLLALGAAVLVVRSALPVTVLAATTVVTAIFLLRDYPDVPASVPLAVATYTLAARASLRTSLVATAVAGGAVEITVAVTEGSGNLVSRHVLAVVVAYVLGYAVLVRRGDVSDVEERASRAAQRLLEGEQRLGAEEARHRVNEERMRIARELHDVIAHGLAMINVQAGVAAHQFDRRPEQAREALFTIKDASHAALQEVRATLGVLRQSGDEDEDGSLRPPPGLDELRELAAWAATAGIDVDLSIGEVPPDLPVGVSMAAYRIAQEAITNVTRHADADHATITVAVTPSTLVIEIDDDGRGAAPPKGSSGSAKGSKDPATCGHGLIGMRERAAAMGGRLDAGDRPGGGYRVRASLPIGIHR
jgi:signal transduction histidine kinase